MISARKEVIVITGSVSLLGKYSIEALLPHYQLILCYHRSPVLLSEGESKQIALDMTKPQQLQKLITTYQPAWFIHLAGLSNIDYCQKHEKEALELNTTVVTNLCKILKNTSTRLLFFSSTSVFDGKNPPYREDDPPTPLNIYGETKSAAEQNIQTQLSDYAIIRASTVLGWPPKGARSNDLPRYLEWVKAKPQLFLVNDRYFNPVAAREVAKLVLDICQQHLSGIYHIGGADRVSRYTLVQKIIEAFEIKNPAQLIPVESSYYKNLAPRPYDATLKTEKITRKLGITPLSLQTMLQKLRLEKTDNPLTE